MAAPRRSVSASCSDRRQIATFHIAGELRTRLSHEPVKGGALVTLNPLLTLRADIERHRRVGVADLAHHPLRVEVVGEQRDRDVGATAPGADEVPSNRAG
jgi:hypothetical protein